jgi:hypothetical protein
MLCHHAGTASACSAHTSSLAQSVINWLALFGKTVHRALGETCAAGPGGSTKGTPFLAMLQHNTPTYTSCKIRHTLEGSGVGFDPLEH